MGVVESGSENLAARNILERRGNPATHLHPGGIDRFGRAEARQGGTEGADQKDRLDHVAARLLDGKRREFAIIQEPSAITRSTARPSCPAIWASETSGTARSPRRSCANSRWAFSMARSPPLTATYIR